MTKQEQERAAERFISALRELASKEENICNFESYLISHFSEWLERYANSPENIAAEMKIFAEMEF